MSYLPWTRIHKYFMKNEFLNTVVLSKSLECIILITKNSECNFQTFTFINFLSNSESKWPYIRFPWKMIQDHFCSQTSIHTGICPSSSRKLSAFEVNVWNPTYRNILVIHNQAHFLLFFQSITYFHISSKLKNSNRILYW